MNPVARAGKRRSAPQADCSQCVICQKCTPEDLRNSDAGIDRLFRSMAEREKYHDRENSDVFERLKSITRPETIKYHKACYSSFTSTFHIEKLKRKAVSSTPSCCFETEASTSRPSLLCRSAVTPVNWELCLFCQESSRKLHTITSTEMSCRILEKARHDNILRCHLSCVSDLVASKAKYHLRCYSAFMRESSAKGKESGTVYDVCFDTLTSELQKGFEIGFVYSMNDVSDRYCSLLAEQLDKDKNEFSHSSQKNKLKSKLLNYFGTKVEFVRQKDSKYAELLFPGKSIGEVTGISTGVPLQVVHQEDEPEETHTLGSDHDQKQFFRSLFLVAQKIRSDLKTTDGHSSCGQINNEAATKVVPDSLYLFLRLLFEDSDNVLESPDSPDEGISASIRKKVLCIGQDVVFAISNGNKLTPKHIGLGLSIHQASRSKQLVKLVHAAGHCISYDTVQRIDTSLAEDQLTRFREHGNVVVPRNLVSGRFLQYAADNIDIIEETLDGSGTFHATQMAAFQRGPPKPDEDQELPIGRNKVITAVPPEFHQRASAPKYAVKPKPALPASVPLSSFQANSPVHSKCAAKTTAWLLGRLTKGNQQSIPAWSGFHQLSSSTKEILTTVGYMPLINAPAHELDTLWEVIRRCRKVSKVLGQPTTVITFDEALYSKAIELLWVKSEECSDVVVRLGSFHFLQAFLKAIGKYLDGSGIRDLWVEAGVYGENTADNIISGKHYNRALRAHKLTMEAVWRLLWPEVKTWASANGKQIDETDEFANELATAFEEHDTDRIDSYVSILVESNSSIQTCLESYVSANADKPCLLYWRQYLRLAFILLNFVYAERVGDWELHVQSVSDMLPYFSAFDHINYFRWGSVYLADMHQLQTKHPDVYTEYTAGNFVVKSSDNRFNQIPVDQALEHVNKIGKTAGGLVGITRNESARNKWGLTYNERARLANDTRIMLGLNTLAEENEHSEIHKPRMKRDEEDVRKLVFQLDKFNVLNTKSLVLLSAVHNDVAPQNVTEALLSVESKGKSLLQEFLDTRLPSAKLFETIHKYKTLTFSSLYKVKVMKDSNASVKADRNIFRRMIVAADAGRALNLEQILCHELSPVPLSIAYTDNSLRECTTKCELSDVVESYVQVRDTLPLSDKKSCAIVDGMAVAQALGKPAGAATFGDLAASFVTVITSHFNASDRVDVVFDRYFATSIKSGTRKKRSGTHRPIRRLVSSRDVPLPPNWQQFISLSENKENLAEFLSNELMSSSESVGPNRELVTAGGLKEIDTVLTSSSRQAPLLMSNHEEADTRMILHAMEAFCCGYERVIIVSRDTDVLLLLLHFRNQLCSEVWLRSGTSQKRRFIPVHDIVIPEMVSQNVLAFHALTGCDSTSKMKGIGKRTAWNVYIKVPELLSGLGQGQLTDHKIQQTEAFVCRLYSVTATSSVNKARYLLFRRANAREPDRLPPTSDALLQHIKRAHYQASIWMQALCPKPTLPELTESGWQCEDGELKPCLMTINPVPEKCLQLVSCLCKKGCGTGRCNCRKSALTCTGACLCESIGNCENRPMDDFDSDEDAE